MKDKQYYKELGRRYFDAETTLSEEQELKLFLSDCDDPEFDELRVTMGFFLVAKNISNNKPVIESSKRTIPILWRYAAAVALFVVLLVPFFNNNSNVCVMYSGGEKFSDRAEVINQMNGEMNALLDMGTEMSVEHQMADMFN